jgi:hypothetical protein
VLQFENRTGFAGTVFASPDPDGVDTLYALVKATFDLNDGIRPAQEQLPVVMADEFYGDPAASSIRLPSDIALVKPGTDVVLLGHAYVPGGRPAWYVDVSLAAGPLFRAVRVFGNRIWESSGAGYSPSSPQPFEAMPLVWELAFGGLDNGPHGLQTHANPVGRGFHVPDGTMPVQGQPLPNLEDPTDPITSWKQTPAAAGFAPIAAHWEPRRAFAGTYDESWQQNRAPFLPVDFDPQFFQIAPPGLTMPGGYFHGGEVIEARGVTPDGMLRFALPMFGVQITYTVAGSKDVRPANLDTVIIEPDAGRVVLVWRAALQCDKKLLKVQTVLAELQAHHG